MIAHCSPSLWRHHRWCSSIVRCRGTTVHGPNGPIRIARWVETAWEKAVETDRSPPGRAESETAARVLCWRFSRHSVRGQRREDRTSDAEGKRVHYGREHRGGQVQKTK